MDIEEIKTAIIGLPFDQACQMIKENGFEYRFTKIDDDLFVQSMDMDEKRFNLVAKDGKIVSVSMG